jgi:hypothetical protein
MGALLSALAHGQHIPACACWHTRVGCMAPPELLQTEAIDTCSFQVILDSSYMRCRLHGVAEGTMHIARQMVSASSGRNSGIWVKCDLCHGTHRTASHSRALICQQLDCDEYQASPTVKHLLLHAQRCAPSTFSNQGNLPCKRSFAAGRG